MIYPLTLTDVSHQDYNDMVKETELRERGFRFRHYDSASQILVIVIPTKGHEALHRQFIREFHRQVEALGDGERWIDCGGTAFTKEHGGGSLSSGGGDTVGLPLADSIQSDHWPTLVVLSDTSQAFGSLAATMRWWFRASDHRVKTVVFLRWSSIQHQIIIEKWEEPELEDMARRSNGEPQPENQQTIRITQEGGLIHEDSYIVDGSALVLSFRRLFGRDPRADLGQGDIIFSVRDLQRLARLSWGVLERGK